MDLSHSRRDPFGVTSLSAIGILVLAVGCAFSSLSLNRLPSATTDEAFFAYPALKASLGGPFTYAVSGGAPFGNQLWAYHGPVLPYLDEALFRLFGFSSTVSRLPDFVGGWAAALLLVLFLNRRGYGYAGVAFAVLWCGDVSVPELLMGRMDGLALLSVVVSFLFLERAWTRGDRFSSLMCGLFCGLSILIHPLCLFFALMEFALISYRAFRREALPFALGASMCIPALLAFWHFRVHQSVTQFRWHSGHVRRRGLLHSVSRFLSTLHWQKPWAVTLMVFIVVSAVLTVVFMRRSEGKAFGASEGRLVLASGMGLASLALFAASPMFSYYLIYMTVWPMLCVVILAETHWSKFRPVAVVLAVVWASSAAVNVVGLQQSIRHRHGLRNDFLYSKVRELVPQDATIEATPRLYSVPIGAGFSKFGLTWWFHEYEDACPSCYLLMTDAEFKAADLVKKSNLDQRKILYAGAAFPEAGGEVTFPIVVLSPEQASNGVYRTDGPAAN